jgi:type II secretory pathway pseudopilin PulG
MVVVIAVLGILTAAVIVNWSSFMRHQDLRADAITLHKEIVALRARAVENGDSAILDAVTGGSACTLKWRIPSDDGNSGSWSKRTIKFSPNVKIDTDVGDINITGSELVKLPGNPAKNNWMSSPTGVKILIHPDTLRDNPINAFADGLIRLKSDVSSVKSRYCIQRDSTCVRPELYHQTKEGTPWKRL